MTTPTGNPDQPESGGPILHPGRHTVELMAHSTTLVTADFDLV